ncbi:hypothetical protein IGL98_001412 [Enterococcus sp. DIV0840]|uniref:bacteriocin immunity protein n=1 Tax=Enterococcus TaxID=1350 RepID=UPI001A8EE0BE|nr:bacteriocin immunity protein [Enterococcus sp. DIV0849a]MBO0474382.1 bacteriocin immunity protein [Enterococcus ureasiticus]
MNHYYYSNNRQKNVALPILYHLIDQFNTTEQQPLKELLVSYQNKLLSSKTDPLLLNKMSLEISNCLIKNELWLSESEALLFKKLFKLV